MSSKARTKKSVSADEVRLIVREVIEEMGLNTTATTIETIAHSAAKQAVHETLLTVGVDTSNPIAAQKVFGALNDLVQRFSDKETQADMAQLRSWRQGLENFRGKSLMTIAGLATAAAVAVFLAGLKGYK